MEIVNIMIAVIGFAFMIHTLKGVVSAILSDSETQLT
jgi:hypothetical protein